MCRELGATWLIVGGYQRVANRLRITARLLAVDTGAVVHTVKIDGTVEEFFVLQDRVADALAAHLGTAGDLSRRRARDDSQPVVRPESLRDPTDRSETAGPVGGGLGPLSTVPVPQRIGRSEVAPLVIDGPPPPEAPQVVSRDVSGRVTIRATEIATPLTLDGRLDEAIYRACMRRRISSNRNRRRVHRRRRGQMCGCSSIMIASTSLSAVGKASPTGSSSTRCGVTTATCTPTTTSPSFSTRSTTAGTASSS